MEQRRMSLKMEFVQRAMQQHVRMSPLCREFRISRQTGYKWLKRFKADGYDGLEECSRRPNSSPLSTAEDVVMGILELREAHPKLGPKKLAPMLRSKFGVASPSVATIARVLRRFNKVRQRSKFRRLSIPERAPKVRLSAPNDLWTVDFKGWWRARDGERCEPLTVRDGFSRYVLAVKVLPAPCLEATQRVFRDLFVRFGLPKAIHVDNGNPFINVQARGGLTRLSAWWVSLGIAVVRSRPGCPQDNGGHERMHRDMAEELQALPAGSRPAQQRACDKWRLFFNNVRPHEALKGKTPHEVYKRSERRPERQQPLYAPSWVVRTVTKDGAINVNSAQAFIGTALSGFRVGLQPLSHGRFNVWLYAMDLGVVELGISPIVTDEVSQRFLARYGRGAA
jgi:transposase InsO family protein